MDKPLLEKSNFEGLRYGTNSKGVKYAVREHRLIYFMPVSIGKGS